MGAAITKRRPPAFVLAICASLTLTVIYNSALPLPPRGVTEAAITLLPLLGIAISHRRIEGRILSPGALILSVGFLIAVIFSALLNGDGGADILVLLAPGLLAVSFAMAGGLLDESDFRTIARWIIILGVVQVLLAFAEVQWNAGWAQALATGPDGVYLWRLNLVLDGIGRASGTMGHPILLGVVCSIAALLSLSRQIVPSTFLRVLLVAGFTYGVVLSGSRSSIAALGVGVIIYFLHPRSQSPRWTRVLMVLALVPILWTYASEAIIGAKTVSVFSLTNRLDAFPRLLETLERPFGNMLFGEGHKFSLETVADNQFLTTSGLYGLVGLLLFVAAIAYAFLSPKPIVTAGVSVVAFMALSFDVLEWGFTAALLWLLVGVAHGGKMKTSDDELMFNAARPHPAVVA